MTLNEPTYQKLTDMRLTIMAAVFQQQHSDPNVLKLEFDDRFDGRRY